MFRPQIQKTRVLLLLSILNVAMVYWALNSYELLPTYGFEIKKEAVELMEKSINSLRQKFIQEGINDGEDALFFGSFLVGPKTSSITTTAGSLVSKQSTLNPDFAALVTEMLMELEIDQSDYVAISYTGSYPGANIAVLSALEALNLKASIISSCGSSEYGATYPQMNWLDMERYLFDEQIISNRSSLASMGGGFDLGSQLGQSGKNACETSIYNAGIEILAELNPQKNIEKRIAYFNKSDNSPEMKLFINVGGGIYSAGDSLKRSELPAGIIYPGDFTGGSDDTVIEKVLNDNIPVININHINILAEWYDLSYPPKKENQIAAGSLFYSKKQFNPLVILIALTLSAGSVLVVGFISHREIKRRMHSSEPESIL